MNSVQPDLGGSPGWDRPRLEELLTLTPTEDGSLCSDHGEINANGTIFGGQLIGQAMAAAAHSVPDDLRVHNMQLNFLSAGRTTDNLHFNVTRLLSGRNFIVQQVLCTQGDRTVLSASVSFHRGETGPVFAPAMPGVPDPDELPTLRQLVLEHADALRLNEAARARVGNSRTLEIRPVNGLRYLLEREPTGNLQFWTRARHALPERQTLHQAALGYLTDYWFPMTSLSPHLDIKINTGLYVASLNHTLWFHAPLRADHWLLVDAQAQSTSEGRGMTHGRIYSREGQHVASVAQETLFRGWDKLVQRLPD